MDYQDGMEWHRKQIQEIMQQYGISEFQFLLDVCNECLETVDSEGGRLSFGLKYAIDGNRSIKPRRDEAHQTCDTIHST